MTVPVVHAHRGSPDPALGIRENSLEAFFRARRLGADGVELDVRRTADGVLVVQHDPELTGLGPVCQLPSDHLPESVALLSEALDACEGLELNIELKNLPGEPGFDPDEQMAREVAELVAGTDRQSGTVVSSFWPGSLEAVHAVRPEVATGLLVASWFDPSACVAMAVERQCGALHPHASLIDGALVEAAHAAGLAVAAWTINDPSRLREVAALGVDTVITDDVTLALSVLESS